MMATATHFSIGIDISKKSMDVALCPEGFPSERWMDLLATKIPHEPNSPEAMETLLAWLREKMPQKTKSLTLVVEATGQLSLRFARAASGCPELPGVSIINPYRSKSFGQSLGVRDKTDETDARVLALYGEKNRPAPTQLLAKNQEQARERSRLRESYLKDLTAWENRLGETIDQEQRARIERTIAHLKGEIESLDEAIEKALAGDEVLERQEKALQKIRGIKKVVSHTLTAELGDLSLYGRGQIVAAAGLFPKRFDSGTSVHRPPRLAKGGGSRIRRVLYMAASSLFRAKGPWPQYIARLRAKGFCKMQIIGILMRKLLLIARSVAISGVYDESKICCGN